jgi:hypothetical protein
VPLPPGTTRELTEPGDFAHFNDVQAGDRRWKKEHLVPHISFLERVTHYVLMRQISMLAGEVDLNSAK